MPADCDDVRSRAPGGRSEALSEVLTSRIVDGLRHCDSRLVEELLRGQVTAYLVIEERVPWPSAASIKFGEPGGLRGRARHAAQAVHVIEADPAAISSIHDLARLTNVSPRTLQEAFKECVGVSPMDYLRRVRLERVHWDLLAADPARETVADIALRYGFSHFGRFAAAYRQLYGCNPSSTLRMASNDRHRAGPGTVTNGDAGSRRVVIPVRPSVHVRRDGEAMRMRLGQDRS